ncbi:uncharacterized protein LOC6593834 [Drosophila persimilis]|nr:uncharacterized protein LOC6593834 [Drosophila persimilis]
MMQSQDESLGDGGSTVLPQTENTSEDPSVGAEQTIDHSAPLYLDHEQISKRFTELLHLFDSCAKIMDGERNRQGHDHDEGLKVSPETVTDSTIKAATSEVSIQTSWSLLEQQKKDCRTVEEGLSVSAKEPPSQVQQHTIHIEVERVPSETEMQRAPLRQRFANILVQTLDAIIGCMFMVGGNITYLMLLSVLCIWCYYR